MIFSLNTEHPISMSSVYLFFFSPRTAEMEKDILKKKIESYILELKLMNEFPLI